MKISIHLQNQNFQHLATKEVCKTPKKICCQNEKQVDILEIGL